MQDLNIILVQSDLKWENIQQNLDEFDRKLKGIKPGIDLVILPEMFSTGFSMNAKELAEDMSGSAISWMKKKAGELNCVIAGSLIIKEEGKCFNRLIWMNPDGSLTHYDKRHLFTLAKENETYSPGSKKLVVELKGWKICPLICYDLRFPVWSRNIENCDLIIYVANWPEKRNLAWKTLLLARAIENQCYVAGVNRIGGDGNDIYYSGDSALIRYDGETLITAAHEESLLSITISKTDLTEFKNKFAFYKDADKFTLQ